jgi:hypothetical protein
MCCADRGIVRNEEPHFLLILMCSADRGTVRHEEPHFLLILILLKTELLLTELTGKVLLFLKKTQVLWFWAH